MSTGTLTYEQSVALRKKYIAPSCTLFYKQTPLKIVRAEGQYMYDSDGTQYLDCVNNVAHVGHCHPRVVEAERNQCATLNTNTRFLNDNILLCAQKLCSLLPEPLTVCFFVNSGSEANDLALQLASHHTGGSEVITVDHAYHGHLTSLISISPYKYNQRKSVQVPDWVHVATSPDTYRGKFNVSNQPEGTNFGALYSAEVGTILEELRPQNKKVSAFIVESLQSCAGQIMLPGNYLREVYKLVRGAGGVCIADEVQVGFGRMGCKYWAFQLQGDDIVPDIVTVGKPMGNGHPVSAVITTRKVADSFCRAGGGYFNTFGGNPVSCAIALTVMDVIESEGLMEKARVVGEYMLQKAKQLYQKHQLVGDVRGQGLFLGVELVKDRLTKEPATEEAKQVLNRLKQEFQIIVTTDGPHENILKMKPPMVFTKGNCDYLFKSMDKILSTLC